MNKPVSRREFLALGAAAAAGGLLLTTVARAADGKADDKKKVVVVWSECTAPKKVFPKDINGSIAEGLIASLPNWEVVMANIDQPDQGLPDELLNRADVLIWWGHKRHGQVKDALVAKIVKRVKEDGMGFIPLHSAHFAKCNKTVMGSPCSWKAYRGDSKTLDIHVTDKKHPIADGIEDFTVVHEERYTDPYAVPKPDSVVFTGTAHMKDGSTETSQQGFAWNIGKARVFYFQVGHETSPVYDDKNVRKIMANAVQWVGREK